MNQITVSQLDIIVEQLFQNLIDRSYAKGALQKFNRHCKLLKAYLQERNEDFNKDSGSRFLAERYQCTEDSSPFTPQQRMARRFVDMLYCFMDGKNLYLNHKTAPYIPPCFQQLDTAYRSYILSSGRGNLKTRGNRIRKLYQYME